MNERTSALLFFSTLYTPFIEEDYRILSRSCDVVRLIAHGVRAIRGIREEMSKADIALAWFGSVYSGYLVHLARSTGKKSIVVVAGIDASKDREIRYGIWLNPWKARCVRYAFRHADRVLVVDPFLGAEARRLARYDGKNIVNIPFGFDGRRWVPGDTKKPIVVTVAACHDKWRMRKKGIDKLFEAASELSHVRFQVIGLHERLLPGTRRSAPPNVELLGFIPRDEILPYLQRAAVYCQPSYTEGLPNALCEAMLCACVPVGTRVGGIPTAIGPAGFIVPYGDRRALVGALRAALDASPAKGIEARDRILREFTVEKREQAFAQVINDLIR